MGPVGRLLGNDVWKFSFKKKWKRIEMNFPELPDEVCFIFLLECPEGPLVV